MRGKRQNAILRLVNEREIETQAELTAALAAIGYEVTQATVSRDIKELRLVKTQNGAGRYVYSQHTVSADGDMFERLNIIFSKCVVNVDHAVNTVVIKTLPGMAQAAGAALDSMHLAEVVGSIAGDDTIIVVVRSEEAASNLGQKLLSIIEND